MSTESESTETKRVVERLEVGDVICRRLLVVGADGQPRVIISANNDDNSARIIISDLSGDVRAGLTLGPRGSPALMLLRKDGSESVVVGMHGDQPHITLLDPTGNPRLSILMLESGEVAVVRTDTNGKLIEGDSRGAVAPPPPAAARDREAFFGMN